MKKPRILIMMHYMELGGAEMALIGLLNAMDPEQVDVDLFIYDHRGPLMKFIPEHVHLLPENSSYRVIERPIKEALRLGEIKVVIGRLYAKWKHKRYRKKVHVEGVDASILHLIGEYVSPFLPNINPAITYDLCISFLNPHQYAIAHVKASKKIAWIHQDYTKIHIDKEAELTVWGAFDKIISISPDVTKTFLSIFPSLSDKILEMENIIPKELISSRSNEKSVENEMGSSFSLLSIGRYSYQKNFDNIPYIAKFLVEFGFTDFKWYIIGYGSDENIIRKKISEAGMEDRVILLGKKENPYPYLKACDVYVQPSRYEGKSITVREAQILGKVVIISNYPTAKSQIQDGYDGKIVELANEECAKGILDVIRNEELKDRIKDYVRSHDYANSSEIEKIYSLIMAK